MKFAQTQRGRHNIRKKAASGPNDIKTCPNAQRKNERITKSGPIPNGSKKSTLCERREREEKS